MTGMRFTRSSGDSDMHEHECGLMESKAFPGPFVRVRGRLSRQHQVQWNPALRVERGPVHSARDSDAVRKIPYSVDFLDYTGKVLDSGPANVYFFAKAQETAAFGARLPYHDHTQTIRLRSGDRTLGHLHVPTDRPCF